jgi:hypothetical protein
MAKERDAEALTLAKREYQLYMKRLRKSGVSARYMAVVEYGEKRGRTHLHALLHVTNKVSKREIEAPWWAGFKRVSLADNSHRQARLATAEYVAKYLTKADASRIMSSVKYGKQGVALAHREIGTIIP